jgi:hypothetical protein
MNELLSYWRRLKRRVPAIDRVGDFLRESSYRVAEVLHPNGRVKWLARVRSRGTERTGCDGRMNYDA